MSRFDARVQSLVGKGTGAKPRVMCKVGLHVMEETRVHDGETSRCSECVRERKRRYHQRKKDAA
jgi:NAD-dependent oxidoreductase involved in siderophore biosynthesis